MPTVALLRHRWSAPRGLHSKHIRRSSSSTSRRCSRSARSSASSAWKPASTNVPTRRVNRSMAASSQAMACAATPAALVSRKGRQVAGRACGLTPCEFRESCEDPRRCSLSTPLGRLRTVANSANPGIHTHSTPRTTDAVLPLSVSTSPRCTSRSSAASRRSLLRTHGGPPLVMAEMGQAMPSRSTSHSYKRNALADVSSTAPTSINDCQVSSEWPTISSAPRMVARPTTNSSANAVSTPATLAACSAARIAKGLIDRSAPNRPARSKRSNAAPSTLRASALSVNTGCSLASTGSGASSGALHRPT